MKGYLMKEQDIIPGEDLFIESLSPENNHGVVFEDDEETGYFYAVERDLEGGGQRILDALHIYESKEEAAKTRRVLKLLIIWSTDWQKCALVLDGQCHAIFDFTGQNGYNINEFPPPNEVWTKGERALNGEIIDRLFGGAT